MTNTFESRPPRGEAVDVAPIPYVSLPEAVREVLRRRILNNEFAAGERLVETKIAEEYGVSRTTLRAALRELANENLVEISSRRGCFVARMDSEAIFEACYARYLLESSAADDVSWITSELIAKLEEQLVTMMAAAVSGDMAAIVDVDTAFHSIIVTAGKNQRVTDLWHMLDGQMGSLMRSSLDKQGIALDEIVERHESVISALRSVDAESIRAAIKDHYVPDSRFDPA